MKYKNLTLKRVIIKDIKGIKIPTTIEELKSVGVKKETHSVYINTDGDFMSIDLQSNGNTITFNVSRNVYQLNLTGILKQFEDIKKEVIEYLEYIDFDKFYGVE